MHNDPVNTQAAELEISAPLIPEKPATGHDPEPVSSTSHPHILLPEDVS
jgi:hypothetical protein